LLTPAPTVAALNRKKAMLRSGRVTLDEVTKAEAEKLIAADEAWLKATGPKRYLID
jgi:hypothetical protein